MEARSSLSRPSRPHVHPKALSLRRTHIHAAMSSFTSWEENFCDDSTWRRELDDCTRSQPSSTSASAAGGRGGSSSSEELRSNFGPWGFAGGDRGAAGGSATSAAAGAWGSAPTSTDNWSCCWSATSTAIL